MQRKQFLGFLAKSTGLLLISNRLPLPAPVQSRDITNEWEKVKGAVTAKGKGIAGVVVSDGYSVIITDNKGNFELRTNAAAKAIFISTPAGYHFPHKNNIASHYKLVTGIGSGERLSFELEPLHKDDSDHEFIIWADPQVRNEKDVQKMMSESVPAVQKTIEDIGKDALIHGITLGDIVWDNHVLYKDYKRAVAKMNIPFFQCLGNHDMDINKGGDEDSDITFHETFGPPYYSFNRGQVHYAVMDNVRYLGKNKEYDGFFQPNQLEWLEKDLSFVPKDKLVVLSTHIPVHDGTKNNEALYALLKDRNVHIMSGHTHYHQNNIRENIFEHNHGTVCGAWWTGSICCDGTPNGYGVYKVKGNELSWHYQSTGEHADHQMKLFVNNFNDTQKQLVVNVWNYDPSWKVEYFADNISGGAPERFDGYDPLASKSLAGPELPKARGFAEPNMTDHLFKAVIPADTKEIKVVVTDRFNKVYTEHYTV